MPYLLKKALANLDSLYSFYISMLPSVLEESKKGVGENMIGFVIDYFFTTLVRNSNGGSEKAKTIAEAIAKEYVEVLEIDKEKRGIAYRIQDNKKTELPSDFSVQKSSEQFEKYYEMPTIHATNTLIGLITRFEEGVSAYLHALFSMFPDRIKDKQVTFKEISGKTAKEVQEYIILREIERIMWASQNEWFKIFEEHKICFDSCKKQLEKLTEIYARRNVWVHNSGRVNEIYVNSVKSCKEELGTLLHVDTAYLSEAFLCIKTILYTLYIESTKFCKENQDQYLYKIFELAYEELQREDYQLCSIIFAEINKCKYSNEQTRIMAKINYWIAQKSLKKFSVIKKEIEKFDTSAMSEEYKVAKLILLEKYDEAEELIEQVYNDKIHPKELMQWPLFKEFRNTKQYDKIRKAHIADFEVEQIEKTNDSNNEIDAEEIINKSQNNDQV